MTNAVVDPHTMVVHPQHAAVADAAVVRARRLEVLALLAVAHLAILKERRTWHRARDSAGVGEASV